jgi:SSS family transporter
MITWIESHTFVVAFLAIYFALLARHAWQGRRATAGMADYYVGGRNLGGITLGLSFFATYSSTNSFIGFAGQGYTYGAPWLLIAPFVVGFSLLAWVLVAPRLRRFTEALNSLTIPDFIGFRFGSPRARVAASALVLFASFFYLTAVFKGIGSLLEAFLQVPYAWGIWITFFIVMTYTAVGGFLSVVKTDAVQGVMLIVAAVILFSGTVGAAGGVGSFLGVMEMPEASHLFAWDVAMPFPVLVGVLFAATIKFVVEPRQLSRFYALRDEREIRRGRLVSTLSFLVVYALLAPIGLYARAIHPTGFTDSDQVVPALLIDPSIFHPGLSAFMLVALLAAAMSSIDSVLLVMASTCHRDLVGRWVRVASDRAAIRATAGYVALFALITTLIALNPPGGIVALSAFSGSVYAACFFPPMILGLYWRRGNGEGVLASLGVGMLVLLVWKPLGIAPGTHEVFPALALSTLSYVGLALWRPSTAAPEVDALFAGAVAPERETVPA